MKYALYNREPGTNRIAYNSDCLGTVEADTADQAFLNIAVADLAWFRARPDLFILQEVHENKS
jgi:hypothetical protein